MNQAETDSPSLAAPALPVSPDPSPAGWFGLNALEVRASIGLVSIYATRMMGLFLVLPVLALYAEGLPGATPFLAGLAIGAYGLTQALLQIPFGMLSDRFGRKPILLVGLLIFALGSVVAALADSITGVILGRVLQGAGAVAAVILALATDLTREEQRIKVVAIIGVSIGAAFAVSMVAGPLLAGVIGVPGLFWLTAVLAGLNIVLLLTLVPTPMARTRNADSQARPAAMLGLVRNGDLFRLNAGIFFLHAALTATFVAIPLMLRDAGLAPASHGWLYLGVFVLSILVMGPALVRAQRARMLVRLLQAGAIGLLLAGVAMALGEGRIWLLAVGLGLFFVAFNVLEATLPSLVARLAPAGMKGSALGLYSTAQFLGAFAGGVGGGWLFSHFGGSSVVAAVAVGAAAWWLLLRAMREPRALQSRVLALSTPPAQGLADALAAVPGVEEAVVSADDRAAYIKVDRDALDEAALARALAGQRPLAMG